MLRCFCCSYASDIIPHFRSNTCCAMSWYCSAMTLLHDARGYISDRMRFAGNSIRAGCAARIGRTERRGRRDGSRFSSITTDNTRRLTDGGRDCFRALLERHLARFFGRFFSLRESDWFEVFGQGGHFCN